MYSMATPLTIAIPPLREGQAIAVWQPLFTAAVSALEDKVAIKLLPAYLKRGRLEEKVVLQAFERETLHEAFEYLKGRFDPEVDGFVTAACFIKWCGLQENQCKIFSRGTWKKLARLSHHRSQYMSLWSPRLQRKSRKSSNNGLGQGRTQSQLRTLSYSGKY